MQALEKLRQEVFRPKRLLEAGLVAASFAALPAIVLISQGSEQLQIMFKNYLRETLNLLALSGMLLSGVTVAAVEVITDVLRSRAIGRRMDAELIANQNIGLDASGVPVVGAEEINE